ncbi:MAG: hypothetical protein Q8R18_03475 [bacterium]|nr:hypothetical protein [bacterium]
MEATIKKWGNSYGVLLRKDELKGKDLHVGDVIEIDIKEKKKVDFTPLFGLCKFKKSVDQIKKELKEEYYE